MGKSRVVTSWSREGAKHIDQRNKKTEYNQRVEKFGGSHGVNMKESLYTGASEPNEDGVYVQRDVYYAQDPSSINTDSDGNQKARYDLIGIERIMKDGKPLTQMVKETDENGNEVEREREVYLPRRIKLSKSLYKRASNDALTDDELQNAIAKGHKVNLDLQEEMGADAWNDTFGKTAPVEYLGAAWAGMADGVPFDDVPALDTLPTKEDVLFSRKSMTDEERNKKARAEQLADYTEDGQDRSDAGSSVEGRKPSYMLFGFDSKEAFQHALKLEKSFDKAVQRNDKNIVRNFTDEDFETVLNLKTTREKINADFEGRDAEEGKAASDSAKKKFEDNFSSIKGDMSKEDVDPDAAAKAQNIADANKKQVALERKLRSNPPKNLVITMNSMEDAKPVSTGITDSVDSPEDLLKTIEEHPGLTSVQEFAGDTPREFDFDKKDDSFEGHSDTDLADEINALYEKIMSGTATDEDRAKADELIKAIESREKRAALSQEDIDKEALRNYKAIEALDRQNDTQFNIANSLKDRRF